MEPVSFLIQIAVAYLLARIQQPNGPRLTDLSAGFGDYGGTLPVLFGSAVRVAALAIASPDQIKETVHKKKPALDFLFGVIGALLPSVKTYTYSDTLALFLADRTNDDPIEDLLKLYAGGKVIFNSLESLMVSESLDSDGRLIYRKYGKSKYCKSVTVYGGGFEQLPDAILAAAIGRPQPGYRGSAYAVLEDFQLKEFGNSVPVPFEALVQVKTDETLASVAEAICAAAGIDPARDLSSTALTHQVVRGYAVTNEAKCWDALKPLLPAFGIDAAEVAGQLRFLRRSQALRATIPTDEMGAYIYGDAPPERFTFRREPDINLPQETALTFLDPDREYQPNTASSQRSEGSAESNISVNLPLVMTADEGASAAALMHWDAHLGRTGLSFTLTDAWRPEVGLAYAVPAADQYVPYRVTRTIRGANGIQEVEAQSDEQVTYTASVAGTSGNAPPINSTIAPETRIMAVDGPLLSDTQDEYGFYLVVAGEGADWTQADIQGSVDGITYLDLMLATESAVVGDVTGTLSAGTTTGLDDTLDTTTVLTVVLLHEGMELESATDAELDAWANLAFVGQDGAGEYLQFKTATFISGTTWQLTNLRRGRKGTDWAIGTHAAGDEFALLVGGGVTRLPASTTDSWGVPISLRGISDGQDEADADVLAFTNTGEGKRPYSPINVEGSWDGSNNLTVTFDVRSRLNAGGLGIDDLDEYEVEFLGPTPRTVTATDPTVAYSAANQTADGLTPGGVVPGRVRQLSDVNDGRWRNFALVGPGADVRLLEDGTTIRHLDDGTNPREIE
jgi:hypothetical protein